MDRLRKDKSAGADGLSPRLLMEAKDESSYHISSEHLRFMFLVSSLFFFLFGFRAAD